MKKILIPLLFIFTAALCGGSNIPLIPEGEVIRYRTTKGRRGQEVEYSSQSISFVSEGGKDFYLIKTDSPDRQIETKIIRESFIPLFSQSRINGNRSDVVRTTSLSSVPSISSEEIALIDMNDLAHVLRAYPFENPKDMNLVILGQGEDMGGMTFRIVYEGEDTVDLTGSSIKTWKLQLKADFEGALSLFSAMMPKTYLWFSQAASRHLVKMTGSEGPGADKEITLEMISYSK